MKVALSNVVLVRLYPVIVPSQEYALALATVLRLYDKSFCLFFVKLFSKLFKVRW